MLGVFGTHPRRNRKWRVPKTPHTLWNYQREKAKVSAALTPEQQEILSKRGVLSPDEIHRFAAKTKKVMTAEAEAKASCHSDYVDPETARQLQENRGDLVELTAP